MCQSVGLNPLTRPFEYISLQGKLVLYARRDAADQLRRIHGISVEIVERKVVGDILVVHVRAHDKSDRTDEDLGTVSVAGLKGEALANAMLKGITKAKRRVTLSICGLGMLDETETEPDDIPPASTADQLEQFAARTPQQRPAAPPAQRHLGRRQLRTAQRMPQPVTRSGRASPTRWSTSPVKQTPQRTRQAARRQQRLPSACCGAADGDAYRDIMRATAARRAELQEAR